MSIEHGIKIAEELGLKLQQIDAVARLLEDGATVPFIARYRKEATGTLDEVAIIKIRDRLEQLKELDKRRESILESLKERELLTPELEDKVVKAQTMSELEDIYLPFKPKRRTRATMAKEKGLEPLADLLWEQLAETDPSAEAEKYVDPEKGVASIEDALAGARDIIAERINEDQAAREAMRAFFMEKSVFQTNVIKGKETEGVKYKDYFEWSEPVTGAPSHRILAMRRGEKEGFITMKVTPPQDEAIKILEGLFVKGESPASMQVLEAAHDCYKRLLSMSMETEVRLETKKQADDTAISVFSNNLRELLLAPFLGQKRVMAIDPGIRTGCKVVCMDPQGKLLYHETIYPFGSNEALTNAENIVRALCARYEIEAIAIGNGTAGRETETFVRGLGLPADIIIAMVNESGASVYSASEVARNEFPDLDISYRGSVSIGRRLMDPLAELVKIDPKSIGVGQYQHDVNQQALKEGLDDIVVSCVNKVGVEVNTASEQLLAYVSGLGPQLAKNIIKYRDEKGPLSGRDDLKNVPRLGPKAFEQAAGFLRISGGANPLDASAVHPESYHIVEKMALDMDCSIGELIIKEDIRKKIDLVRYVSDTIGMPTLNDIMEELAKPGRDPREQFELFKFTDGVEKIDDVKPGMRLPGVVTNVTAFGAFVDIGVHQDGLVHVSQLADHFVKDPNKVVKVNQRVKVTVMEVDLTRHRISLTMKENPDPVDASLGQPKQKPLAGGQRNRKIERKKPEPFNNPFRRLMQ
ncbi:MAG: RNA-binding transcriptional accessory protein [Deltaproteobacteria bacterium]|nr:RNA-binding transcriptional accessory protein [Deltaproteobacteria bacterium]